MYKLYLDTSTKFLCVGITKDETILYEYEQVAEKKQSELAIPVLKKALNHCKLQLKDIQEVCVTIGPGSFTGIRIGMCIAKTLAYANQIPLKAISSLNAYATADASVVLLDAKASGAGAFARERKRASGVFPGAGFEIFPRRRAKKQICPRQTVGGWKII